MSSFISRFKSFFSGSPKRQLAFCAGALVFSLAFSVVYTLYLNPENVFFEKVRNSSLEWGKSLDAQFESKYVVVGGSSTAVGVIPELLLSDYNLPVVNAGLHAGFGYPVITELALDSVNEGDILIVAMETDLMINGDKKKTSPRTTAGDKFFFAQKGAPYSGTFYSSTWSDVPSLYLGSTADSFVLLGKIVTGMPLYRYDERDNLREHSGMKITEQRPLVLVNKQPDHVFFQDPLSFEARKYLEKLRDWAQDNGVPIMYSLPRRCASEQFRPVFARYLLAISEYMPVLKDECLGCYNVAEEYADTINHLIPQGAEKATRELARELLERDFWTREELLLEMDKSYPPGK